MNREVMERCSGSGNGPTSRLRIKAIKCSCNTYSLQ